jgi:hypothetical protein
MYYVKCDWLKSTLNEPRKNKYVHPDVAYLTPDAVEDSFFLNTTGWFKLNSYISKTGYELAGILRQIMKVNVNELYQLTFVLKHLWTWSNIGFIETS